MKRTILLLLGDTHAGSQFGLVHPETELEREAEDGKVVTYNPELSEIQKFLFHDIYRPGIQEVMKFAGSDEVVVFHNGDVTQGVVHDKSPISTQLLIAVTNLSEILKYKNVKKLRLMKGTISHSLGDDSDSDLLVASILRKSFPEVDIATNYHGEFLVEDVDTLIDISHHGPSKGVRKWLEGNQFRFYMRDILLRKSLRRKRLPDIISRAHTHGKLEEFLSLDGHRCWGFITPPLQFPSGFVRQITRSVDEVEMGMLMVEIIYYGPQRKTIYPHWITRRLDITTKEVL